MKLTKLKNVSAMIIVAVSTLGYANDSEAPSVEFIEFLAEFSEVDTEDFDLLVYHALEDQNEEGKVQEAVIPVVEEHENEEI